MRPSLAVRLLASVAVLAGVIVAAAPAQAATVVVRASDDASVEQGRASTNFGAAASLVSDGSPMTRALLRFDVGSLPGPVATARLRLWVFDKTSNGPELWRAGSFEEERVTWSTRPATTTRLADPGSVSANRWLEFDVTSAVTGAGTHAFALVPDSIDGMDVNSDEASSNRPELVIETGDPPPSSTTSSSTTSSSSTSSSSTSTSTSTTATTGTTTTTQPPPSPGSYAAVDDTYVDESNPGDNFGDGTTFEADDSPVTRALLEFRVPALSGVVSRARLRLWATGSSSNGPEVWRTGAFNEDTVTWSSAPPLSSMLADVGSISRDRWVEYDVTAAVTGGGTYAFALVGDSSDGADFSSKEASTNRPELVVETGTEPPPPPPSGDSFQIGLIGDTGYNSAQEEALLDTQDDMNGFPLAFVAHAGDIWGGGQSCTESRYEEIRDVFNGFEAPFVYTPGDNEWEDCSSTGGRLDMIRDIFFPTVETLGENPMVVTRQTPTYVENARWTHRGVVFATINEPGSSGSSGSQRDANVDWLHAAFDLAEDTDAPGIMLIWQDNSFSPSGGTLYRELRDRTVEFGRPVVLVHGDTHHHEVDRPWSDADNFTRVEVFGTSDSGEWVRATVDPADPDVFSFTTERP